MRIFDYSKLNCVIDNEILGYIAKIHEYKGKTTLLKQLVLAMNEEEQKSCIYIKASTENNGTIPSF
ncbi:MAG: hypothetical protein E7064_08910 [Spirochaetaceae bacterium]|nr:hypothetical protein [Spirochaetaceae bacterium]